MHVRIADASIVAFVCLAHAVVSAAAIARPNVLFLWADDVGYGDIGCFGNKTMKTPNIDRLAASGMQLTAHYVPSPLCTPSRAALMTGRHAIRTGMTSEDDNFGVMGLGPGRLPAEEVTIAEVLRAAGYSTAMVGKWHLGGPADERAMPTRHGFDTYWGMPHSNVQACRAGHQEYEHATLLHFVVTRRPTDRIMAALGVMLVTPWLFKGGRQWRLVIAVCVLLSAALILWFTASLTLLNQRGACILYANDTLIEQPVEINYLTLRHTEQATNFLDTAARPFFLYMSYPNAHTALFAMDSNKGKSAHGPYGDNVEEMDWSIGVILDWLDQRSERDQTLIYFATDNGPFREELEEGGACGFAPILPAGIAALPVEADAPLLRATTALKGAKGQTWECGVRVPAILSWPARWRGGRALHTATSSLDLLPTVLTLATIDRKDVRFSSELARGEAAGPMVLDGRDLTHELDGQAGSMATKDEDASFLMLYCGARVAAVRHGRFKAHFTSTKWTDEKAQICKRNVICGCHGHTHDPPLLFDLHVDPAELQPLDITTPVHAAAIQRIVRAKAKHEATVTPVPSQTALLPSPMHFPCCNAPKHSIRFFWKVLTNTCGC